MNHPPPEERLPGSSYRNRYPFILPSKSKVRPCAHTGAHRLDDDEVLKYCF